MSDNLKYTCLFGGGAMRGLAYIGTLRAFEELNIHYDIIAGSSVGSVFAALLACGYKSYEIENLFLKVNFDLFRDIHFGIGKPFAISKGEIFENWLDDLLAKNTNKKNLKFKDLDTDLIIITTNLKTFTPQEFSRFTTPDFEIAKAIRISSSMPGLFPPYKFKGGELVDGDLQKASPMWNLSKNIGNSQSRIIELRLEGKAHDKAKTQLDFINTIYSCVTDVASKFVTDIYGRNDRYDCITLNTGSMFFADFNLNKDLRRELIELGYQQTMNYFTSILPAKKEKLIETYKQILKYLKNAQKGLKGNNVEEVQWWFGDIFEILCEQKEIIDPLIYQELIQLNKNLKNAVGSFLLVYTTFKKKKELENEMNRLVERIESRLQSLQMYISSL